MRAWSGTWRSCMAAALAVEVMFMLALLLLWYGRARAPPPLPKEKEDVIGRPPDLEEVEALET